MSMTAVSSYLRVLREDRGLSREKLGEMIDVAGNTIWRIEDGRQEPGGAILLNLVRAVRGSYEDVRRLLSDDAADELKGRELAQARLGQANFAKLEELHAILGDEVLVDLVQRLADDPDLVDAINRLTGDGPKWR